MDTSKKDRTKDARHVASPKAILSSATRRQQAQMVEALAGGTLPSSQDLEALKRLKELESTLPRPEGEWLKKAGAAVLLATTAVMLSLPFVRLRSTRVDVDVRLSGLSLGLHQADGKPSMIMGEQDEVVVLKRAKITRADEMDFAHNIDPSSIESPRFQYLSVPTVKSCETTPQPGWIASVLLHLRPSVSTTLPCTPSTVQVQLAFDNGTRGIGLEASGDQPTTASLNTGKEVSPGLASGRKLRVELYPNEDHKPVVVGRGFSAVNVSYKVDGTTTVRGGTISVRNLHMQEIPIRSGDELNVRADEPAYVREIVFTEGEIRASVSYLHAKTVSVGSPTLQNLMPTVFDWVQAQWPTQLYATITAIAAAWLGFKAWIEKGI